jgi:hypothetical protein
MTLLEDPFVVEEEVPLQLANDVTTYIIQADGVALQSDYSQKVSMAGKKRVCRVLWAPPLIQYRSTAGRLVRAADSRGRLVTPLGFSVKATNLTRDPVTWHVNTPYQEGSKDSAIVARVADKVVILGPGQTRTHAHQWGNGAHMFPLRGLAKMLSTDTNTTVAYALADYFFLRDAYGVSNLKINDSQEYVKVEVSIRYTLDRAIDIDTDLVETRKAVAIVDLGDFNALYHLDPVTVTTGPIAGPVFTTPETDLPFIGTQVVSSDQTVVLIASNSTGITKTLEKFRGVPSDTSMRICTPALLFPYKTGQLEYVYNTFAYQQDKWVCLDSEGSVLKVTGNVRKITSSSSAPCIAYISGNARRQVVKSRLAGGRVATDQGLNAWPEIVIKALTVGTKILALLMGGVTVESRPRMKTGKKKKNKAVKSKSK